VPRQGAVASEDDHQTTLFVVLGATVFLFGGLAKMGLDLSNSRTKRVPAGGEKNAEPLVIPGMQMPPEDGWTYHPPPPR